MWMAAERSATRQTAGRSWRGHVQEFGLPTNRGTARRCTAWVGRAPPSGSVGPPPGVRRRVRRRNLPSATATAAPGRRQMRHGYGLSAVPADHRRCLASRSLLRGRRDGGNGNGSAHVAAAVGTATRLQRLWGRRARVAGAGEERSPRAAGTFCADVRLRRAGDETAGGSAAAESPQAATAAPVETASTNAGRGSDCQQEQKTPARQSDVSRGQRHRQGDSSAWDGQPLLTTGPGKLLKGIRISSPKKSAALGCGFSAVGSRSSRSGGEDVCSWSRGEPRQVRTAGPHCCKRTRRPAPPMPRVDTSYQRQKRAIGDQHNSRPNAARHAELNEHSAHLPLRRSQEAPDCSGKEIGASGTIEGLTVARHVAFGVARRILPCSCISSRRYGRR